MTNNKSIKEYRQFSKMDLKCLNSLIDGEAE